MSEADVDRPDINRTDEVAPPPADDDHHRPPDDKEIVYFEGSPQLRSTLGKDFIYTVIGLCLIAIPFVVAIFSKDHVWPIWEVTVGLLVIGLILLAVPWITAKTVRYRISNYRIDYERGLLKKQIDTMELWHVEDIHFEQGLLDRMFNVGTITVMSNDKTTPRLVLHGLPHPRDIFDSLKQSIIAVKRQSGVMKMDR